LVEIFKKSVEDFHPILFKLEGIVGKPNLVEKSGFSRFEYPEKNIITICLIKSARIISSLNAIVVLFEHGFIVEVGIIIRTIKEACADISFLLEDYDKDQPTKSQKQYINEFFTEEFEDVNDPINTARKHHRVPTRKIHAGFARNIYNMSKLIKNENLQNKIQKLLNPSIQQSMTQVILNTWSGYVHYGYRHSLELVGGNNHDYHLEGMNNTPKMTEWQDNLISEFFAVYNHFLEFCLVFNFDEEFKILKNKQLEFQNNTGYNP